MKKNELLPVLFEQFKTHANLVGAGVDNRSALEMSCGKDIADKCYETLSQIAKKENQPNIKNN